MPPRSFYVVPDFAHIEALLREGHTGDITQELLRYRQLRRAPLIRESSLALALGLPERIVHGIARAPAKHYRVYPLVQKNGKERTIAAPRTYLKVIQWWILDNVLVGVTWPEYVQGFVAGRGPMSNAQLHAGAKHILNVDLKDFFPSITRTQVTDQFVKLGYPLPVARQLSALCCLNGALPQGAPTSPAISNLCALSMDAVLNEYATAKNLKYTRYADDLTFSSNEYIDKADIEKLCAIVRLSGFTINARKTKIGGTGDRLEVTGLVINNGINMPRKWRRWVRSALHHARQEPNKFAGRRHEMLGYISALKATGQHIPSDIEASVRTIPDALK